ncbi:Maleylpyruvate isomerase [Tepidimonas fonticaldi]|uniref:Maleylacetoacetate isomerase n=1 Tax=Tepidimonas fonticaldi TaxID=1101373 RepID=A0A1A6DVJ3_9BURK|nr:maleylacetoacetate isomerase [Tepidimonas fonticaldi]OBS30873.1 maleylacetoacetate isomerase [Tepidimonas fonticaldi]TSE38313.1 Maleylpyruvate isomerase [Tepidimonas fonticaldi]
MKLYNYFRSGTSFRVRIALHLKGLDYEYIPVHLAKGEQHGAAYRALSPDSLVPVLDVEGDPDHARLSQSMAIIEYLDETHPEPPLLPRDPLGRARVRALAQTVACEIHPINNLRILKYLAGPLGLSEQQRTDWYNHWVMEGLRAYERRLQDLAQERARLGLPPSVYSYGDTPTLADCCLVPQIVNGRRFGLEYEGIPLTLAVFERCMQLEAFQRAHPSRCPDAE